MLCQRTILPIFLAFVLPKFLAYDKFPKHKRRLMKLNLVKKTSASLLRQPLQNYPLKVSKNALTAVKDTVLLTKKA